MKVERRAFTYAVLGVGYIPASALAWGIFTSLEYSVYSYMMSMVVFFVFWLIIFAAVTLGLGCVGIVPSDDGEYRR
tara:strand:+ start:7067 stop:7294 length:228 start_codon:yes stop_codon:yes gene_type:complete